MKRRILKQTRTDARLSVTQKAYHAHRRKAEKPASSEKAELRRKILFELVSDESLRSEGEKLCAGNSFDALVKRRKFLQKLKDQGINVPSSKERLFEN